MWEFDITEHVPGPGVVRPVLVCLAASSVLCMSLLLLLLFLFDRAEWGKCGVLHVVCRRRVAGGLRILRSGWSSSGAVLLQSLGKCGSGWCRGVRSRGGHCRLARRWGGRCRVCVSEAVSSSRSVCVQVVRQLVSSSCRSSGTILAPAEVVSTQWVWVGSGHKEPSSDSGPNLQWSGRSARAETML